MTRGLLGSGLLLSIIAGMGAASLTDKFVPNNAIAKYGGGFAVGGLGGVVGVGLRDVLLGATTSSGSTTVYG